jgi:hypothetical protein
MNMNKQMFGGNQITNTPQAAFNQIMGNRNTPQAIASYNQQMINRNTSYSPQSFNLISRDELKRLSWDEGKSDAEIATMYHVTANEVNRKRRQMNLVQGQMTTAELADIVRLAEAVKTLPMEAIQEIKGIVGRYSSPL